MPTASTPPSQRQNALPMGTRIERFRLDRVLGTGSFGITYEAWDTQLERRVALKEYFPQESARRDLDSLTVHASEADASGLFEYGLSRFLDEARTLARFRHPNIVGVQQYIEANGTALLVMDFEEGQPLSSRITQGGLLDEEALRALAVPLLDGLREVHQEGVLHRDIKPANVLLRADGSPVLLDFGAARQLTPDKHLTIVLTPKYAPIEQYASDQAQGPWTDLYALGATLFHAATGRTPMLATERLIAKPGQDTVPHLLDSLADSFSANFLGTLAVMLQPDPDDRPRTACAVLDMLGGAAPVPTLQPASRTGGFAGFAGDDAPTVAYQTTSGTLTRAQREAAGMSSGTRQGATTADVFPPPESAAAAPAPQQRTAIRIAAALGVVALAALGGVAYLLSTDGAPEASSSAATPAAAVAPALATAPASQSAAAAEPAPIRIADRLDDGGTGPQLIVIPAGVFLRGSPETEYGRDTDEGPRTRVRINAPFALGATEVTVAEYMRFTAATGYLTDAEREPTIGCRTWNGSWDARPGVSWRDPGYAQGSEHPVVCLSWYDALAYTQWLSEQTGYRYDLPSEAQWEYAARAGTSEARFWGAERACDYANLSDTARARASDLAITPDNVFVCDDAIVYAAPAASYQANAFGLHDTLGNVWEWTRDCWADSYLDAPVDGSATDVADCARRTYRGGSWVNPPRLVRSASRGAEAPAMRYFNTGFRVQRMLQPGDPGFGASGAGA